MIRAVASGGAFTATAPAGGVEMANYHHQAGREPTVISASDNVSRSAFGPGRRLANG